MMNFDTTTQRLIALANDPATSEEERRTAAVMAVRMIHRRGASPSSGEDESARQCRETMMRRFFSIELKSNYMAAASKVFDALGATFQHPGTEVAGRAELNRLVYALANVAGDVVLDNYQLADNLAEIRACLPVVAEAFSEWSDRQPPVDRDKLRSDLLALFTPKTVHECLNVLAAAVHAPVPEVAAMLETLVNEGELREKRRGAYTRVLRRKAPKVA